MTSPTVLPASRSPLISPGRCGYCDRERDDLVTCADGLPICLGCRRKEQLRYAAMTDGECNRCPYHIDWHDKDGACPTEAEARDRSGAQ
jgi:hypothetical protein